MAVRHRPNLWSDCPPPLPPNLWRGVGLPTPVRRTNPSPPAWSPQRPHHQERSRRTEPVPPRRPPEPPRRPPARAPPAASTIERPRARFRRRASSTLFYSSGYWRYAGLGHSPAYFQYYWKYAGLWHIRLAIGSVLPIARFSIRLAIGSVLGEHGIGLFIRNSHRFSQNFRKEASHVPPQCLTHRLEVALYHTQTCRTTDEP